MGLILSPPSPLSASSSLPFLLAVTLSEIAWGGHSQLLPVRMAKGREN